MTAKERKEFEKELWNIARNAHSEVYKACARISLPLEIEALKVMRSEIDAAIDAKYFELNNLEKQ